MQRSTLLALGIGLAVSLGGRNDLGGAPVQRVGCGNGGTLDTSRNKMGCGILNPQKMRRGRSLKACWRNEKEGRICGLVW
jgi:hypothetical protein